MIDVPAIVRCPSGVPMQFSELLSGAEYSGSNSTPYWSGVFMSLQDRVMTELSSLPLPLDATMQRLMREEDRVLIVFKIMAFRCKDIAALDSLKVRNQAAFFSGNTH